MQKTEYWGEFAAPSGVSLSTSDLQHILECTRKQNETERDMETEDDNRRFVLYRNEVKPDQNQSKQLTVNVHEIQPYYHMMELNEYIRKMDGVSERMRKKKQSKEEISSQSSSIYRRQREEVFIVDEPPLMVETDEIRLSKEVLNEQVCYEVEKRVISTILCCYGFSDCTSEVLALLVDVLHDWFLSSSGDVAKILHDNNGSKNVLAVLDALGGLPRLVDFYTIHIPALHSNLVEMAERIYQETVDITVDDQMME